MRRTGSIYSQLFDEKYKEKNIKRVIWNLEIARKAFYEWRTDNSMIDYLIHINMWNMFKL